MPRLGSNSLPYMGMAVLGTKNFSQSVCVSYTEVGGACSMVDYNSVLSLQVSHFETRSSGAEDLCSMPAINLRHIYTFHFIYMHFVG